MSESVNAEQTPPRLCHVIKKENFDGYGFNLHAEKGKPGQYIGKVDDGSPAESSGLKQGDRILEVNGCSIGNETHKQVVQRIKALANEVQLLVIDSNVNVTSDNRLIENVVVPSSNGNVPNESNSENSILAKNMDDDNKKSSIEQQQVAASNTVALEPKQASSSVKSDNSNNDLLSMLSVADDQIDSSTIDEKTLINQNDRNSNSNNSSTSNNSSNNTAKEGLNLNMTAAELRAKLAAKKKFDPKTDAVDLRQKFEIIQKL